MRSAKIYGAFAVLIFMVLFFIGCSNDPSVLPKDIMGTWKTQSKDSTGVYIEFKERSLIISSDLGVVENSIVKVKTEKDGAGGFINYSIYYTDRGGKTASMVVIYSPKDGGTLMFKSDPGMIWKRSG